MINFYFALLVTRVIKAISSVVPQMGGTALPGLVALKIDKSFIRHFVEKNQLNSIIITGTNGKTTTTRLLGAILDENKTPYIHNRTGSNLLRGVASTLISKSTLLGKLPHQLAIWEIDEAVVPSAIKKLSPTTILFTNLFRDQLDRYGEIDTILKKWIRGLKHLSKSTQLIVNLDDPSLNYLSSKRKGLNNISFGLSKNLNQRTSLSSSADAIFCPNCHQSLNFSSIFTSHLGHYSCTSCSFKRGPATHLPKSQTLPKSLNGIHNHYNVLAATTIAKALKIKDKVIKKAIESFKPAFGRSESFKLGSKKIFIHLVKNPTGYNVILETLKNKQKLTSSPLLLILNDLVADGTDVSWIWDVDFNYLKNRSRPIIVSGLRYSDLALRLKYAGVDPKLIISTPSISKALNSLKNQSGSTGYILPTYTAMLSMRNILRQRKLIHSTWKD